MMKFIPNTSIWLFASALLFYGCLPKAALYPYKEPAALLSESQKISQDLENYILKWQKGEVSPKIPLALIPKGIDSLDCKNYFLQKYEELNPENQWAVRYAAKIDHMGIRTGIPDPHVTYLLLGAGLAPFGSKVVIEGEYPYCRFFSIQISPPFDGLGYTANYAIGTCENSVADVDIPPMEGNENPFLPGANRLTEKRKYHVEFELKQGKATALDPDFAPPYRNTNQKIVGALLINQGPWYKILSGKGEWNRGLIWIRIYAPDKGKDALGGVPLPKIYYVLPNGEKYFINCDWQGMEKRVNQGFQAKLTAPSEPRKEYGPDKGWGKSFGILQSIGIGVLKSLGRFDQKGIQYINKADLGATGRGENQEAPHNYEPHATTNNYATYLGRNMSLGKGKVIVLAGKMPTFPDTRNHAQTMDTAQVRYWSLGTYDYNPFNKTAGGVFSSVMDDEVILDKDRNYILVYSLEADRPKNANPENGVTWINWGPISTLGFLMRWVSVSPSWICPWNPHEENLPWKSASEVGSAYNPLLINTNDQKGWMGEYLPKIYYMRKESFEKLGDTVRIPLLPEWKNLTGE